MASYFLQSGYGVIKGACAVAGLVTGLGVVGGGAYLIISETIVLGALLVSAGGISVFNSIFNFIDVKSWLVMKKSIDELEKVRKSFETTLEQYKQEREKFGEIREKLDTENNELKSNIDRFEVSSIEFEEENKKLQQTAQQYQDQLSIISKLAEDRDTELKNLKELQKNTDRENQEFSKNNAEYKESLQKATQLNELLSVEVATHKEIRRRLEDHVSQLEKISKDYEEQNISLQATVEKNKEQLVEAQSMIESLKSQLTRFQQLYESMKQLVNVMSAAGAINEEYHKTIGDDITALNNTTSEITTAATMMINVVDKIHDGLKARTKAEFELLDKNHDGVISEEEFIDEFAGGPTVSPATSTTSTVPPSPNQTSSKSTKSTGTKSPKPTKQEKALLKREMLAKMGNSHTVPSKLHMHDDVDNK